MAWQGTLTGNANLLCRILSIALFALVAIAMTQWETALAFGQSVSAPAQSQFVGRAGCAAATCHGGVVDSSATWHSSATVWEAKDPHTQAGLRLKEPLGRQIIYALTPAAEQDATLFEQTVRSRCISCHAPEIEETPTKPDWSQKLLTGVGCESCHGAAARWIDAHTRRDYDPLSIQARQLGMLNTKTLPDRVENCVRCHIGSRSADGWIREVNHDLLAAGHPRLFFDPLVMEKKLPAHWSTQPGAAMSHGGDENATELQRRARQVVLVAVERLKTERLNSTTPLPRPEFSEIDCRACHRSLSVPADAHRASLHPAPNVSTRFMKRGRS